MSALAGSEDEVLLEQVAGVIGANGDPGHRSSAVSASPDRSDGSEDQADRCGERQTGAVTSSG